MTPLLYVLWFVMTLLAYALLFAVQIPLRRGAHWVLKAILFPVKTFLLLLFAYVAISISTWVTWNSGYVLAALHVALLGDLLTDLVTLPFVIARKGKGCLRLQAIFCLVLTLCVFAYGTANMEIIKGKEHTYESSKITQDHRFVFLSDLHYGSSQSAKTVEKAIAEIVELNPEFILLGGDITDEHTTKEEMERIYSILGSTGITTYFIYGNHDRQPEGFYIGGNTYTAEELEKTIKDNGITILKDSWIQVAEDLIILGREDFSDSSRIPVEELKPRPEGPYVVLIDHSPYQTEDMVATGADLQISGHTHAGQFFPLQLIYNLLGYDAYGEYRYGDTELYVSPGITGWYFPLRTEAHCNYEIVNLVPAK